MWYWYLAAAAIIVTMVLLVVGGAYFCWKVFKENSKLHQEGVDYALELATWSSVIVIAIVLAAETGLGFAIQGTLDRL